MSSSNDVVLPQAAQSSDSQQSSKASRGPRPRLFLKDRCQADNCSTADLSKLRFYNRRNHICLNHQKVDQYSRRGQIVRFCQRCAVGHPLEDFDGGKRSCRHKLEKFNSRRRKSISTPAINKKNQGSPSSSLLSEGLSGLRSELHDLDNIDLGFDIGELLPVKEEFNLDLLLADAAPPALPAAAAIGALAAAAEAEAEAAAVAGGEAQPTVSAANSINCNERVCCNTMDAECMCCQSSGQHQQDDANVATSSSPASAASADDDVDACPAGSVPSVPAATSDCDDSNACLPGPSHKGLVAEDQEDEAAAAPTTPNAQVAAAAAAAMLEAEFAALQATDAAMYAMIVHQQIMQARLLLATTANALLLQRARSASLSTSQFSRKESFGEISPMVT
ncbi:hypothetical protein Ndes2526B_g07537 [Nannochloris sp. 'desiccata']|nr:hypothetical protein KSW81_001209 [Chlorella desiccata (nom. nud.)]KAH7617674.1 putative Squamosa promoter-binding-like protein 1 [Chlorella desiccata (nom. nud.)]